MNILFCGNSRAFDGILIAVLSITKYYKGELNIYILPQGLKICARTTHRYAGSRRELSRIL